MMKTLIKIMMRVPNENVAPKMVTGIQNGTPDESGSSTHSIHYINQYTCRKIKKHFLFSKWGEMQMIE